MDGPANPTDAHHTDLQPHFDAAFHIDNERAYASSREAALHGSLPSLRRARRHREDMGALITVKLRRFALSDSRWQGTCKHGQNQKRTRARLMYHTYTTSLPVFMVYLLEDTLTFSNQTRAFGWSLLVLCHIVHAIEVHWSKGPPLSFIPERKNDRAISVSTRSRLCTVSSRFVHIGKKIGPHVSWSGRMSLQG